MKSLRQTRSVHFNYVNRQRGAVLFVALIALVTLMLAAVALVRTVDTATVISGNLSFKQAATTSGDGGVERAIAWLAATNTANAGKDPFLDANHDFNTTNAAAGYYSNIDPALNLTAAATWAAGASADAGTDASGNAIRYIIQRMCRNANQVLSEANCLFSDAASDTDSHNTGQPFPQKGGKSPLNRVTVRITGPKNTVSYTQAFIY